MRSETLPPHELTALEALVESHRASSLARIADATRRSSRHHRWAMLSLGVAACAGCAALASIAAIAISAL